jgi:hypothetical protein
VKRAKTVTCGLAAGLLCAAAAMYAERPSAPAKANDAADERKPVLLELFTSEGCSSCPPADRLLASYDSGQPFPGVELVVLSEHVDYWNRLGWTDPFSSPQFTARQQDYVTKLHLEGAYTPQLVIDGQKDVVGSDGVAARAAILAAAKNPTAAIELKAERSGASANVMLRVSGGAPKADVYVALANDRAQSHVTRGENSGRNLQHVAVVRKLLLIGKADARGAFTQQLTLPLTDGGAWRVVVFVADSGSRRVVGAAQVRL